MRRLITWSTFIMMIAMAGCHPAGKKGNTDIFSRDNLVAWCIVPFDASERSPQQRANMLAELGISKLAYDYREKHIPTFPEEIRVMNEYKIELSAVWLWLDPQGEDLLGDAGRAIFRALEESGTHTELWVSFPGKVFEGLSHEAAIHKAVKILTSVLQKAEGLGCTLALYNHGDWFGEPENQVEIIRAMGSDKVRIVYNFHHGHHQIERFSELLGMMLPYLSTINVSGMSLGGPKIIPVGKGESELEMLNAILASGYEGPIGILGHTEGKDIRPVLERNLAGLERLKEELEK